jgi:prepilin-type N-terminal cleavage/methylation domain-containing protein
MRTKGFTLIELLIVVAIILIIAAIAVPNLLQSSIRANEADVIKQLQNYATAQEKFRDEGASALPSNNAAAGGAAGWFADNHRNLYYGNALKSGTNSSDETANIRLINKEHADAFRTDGLAGVTPTNALGPEAAPDAPAPFKGYFFTEPLDVPPGFFEKRYAQLAIPEDSSRTGNRAFFIDDNGAIRALVLPGGQNADEIMKAVGGRTPLSSSADWETIR